MGTHLQQCANCGADATGCNFCPKCGKPVSNEADLMYGLRGQQINMREVAERYKDRKIEAIKYIRDETGLGLKEAKDAVDAAFERYQRPESYVRPAKAAEAAYEIKKKPPVVGIVAAAVAVTAAVAWALHRYLM